MAEIQVTTLPMKEEQWERLGVQQEGASLFIPICLAEGEILSFMDGKGEVTLIEILNQVKLPKPIIMMSIGGLIMEGVLAARRCNKFILLNKKI